MKHLQVHIDKVDDDSQWITGYIGDGTYEFYAKVDDEPNNQAVLKGRIIKLVIKRGNVKEKINEEEFWNDVVVNYDRGWIIKPEQKNSSHNEIMYAIIDELEKIACYNDRIYGGSILKKMVSKTKNALSFNQ